jgi:hypothetical protein
VPSVDDDDLPFKVVRTNSHDQIIARGHRLVGRAAYETAARSIRRIGSSIARARACDGAELFGRRWYGLMRRRVCVPAPRSRPTDEFFWIGSRSLLSISHDAVRPYEQNQGRGTMTTQDTTRRVVEGCFAAWTAKKANEACALLRALLLWAAALSVSAMASFGTATWLLLVNSHLPF